MAALPAVLEGTRAAAVERNGVAEAVGDAALPAVLVSLKYRLALLVMAALPAVLLLIERQVASEAVGDGGVAGRAGVVEIQGSNCW